MTKGQTPSQTVGPYFAYGLTPAQYGYPLASIASADLRTPEVQGQQIRIEGRVLDGNGAAVDDAMIEIWQADPQGRYAHPADARAGNVVFKGFGRCGTGTDPDNRFVFDSLKPGAVDGAQAPHINVIVFMRGLLSHLYTRLYFADEAEANAGDPVLQSVPEQRRGTLIAERGEDEAAGEGVAVYRFDIHMQGDKETVFFDV
jgi:protocatechuate 3,4-dioxygenase alpha subunit